MNAKELLLTALAPAGLPVYATVYEGRGDEFVVYLLPEERPELCGDDWQLTEICYPQVHYFTRRDPTATKKRLRALLRRAGFVVTGTEELYEKDTRYHHVIISAEIDGEIDDDEGGTDDGV